MMIDWMHAMLLVGWPQALSDLPAYLQYVHVAWTRRRDSPMLPSAISSISMRFEVYEPLS